ncbi:transmembrane proteins 14C [Wolffia australiana]
MEASCIRLLSAGFGSNGRKQHQTQLSWRGHKHLSFKQIFTNLNCICHVGANNNDYTFNKRMTVAYSNGNSDSSRNNLTSEESTEETTDIQPNGAASVETKRTAKIHDFCLGIPFGAIVTSGGFVGYLFSRNTATLGVGLLFGAPLLFLSCVSLRVWRQGQSSLPFILGQGALAAALFWKHFQSYSITKKFFFPGMTALYSVAMLCFYSYILLAGGNPPPKAKKAALKSA